MDDASDGATITFCAGACSQITVAGGLAEISTGEITANSVAEQQAGTDDGGNCHSAGTMTIATGQITGNSAPDQGDGIYISSGSVTLVGSGVTGDSAGVEGGV